jgi:hypothetical protein
MGAYGPLALRRYSDGRGKRPMLPRYEFRVVSADRDYLS